MKPLVLFVCKHNTGRSQMAEAFLRRSVGDDVDVASAGTIAADRPDPGEREREIRDLICKKRR
ncbi:MAG: hypothetical protein IAI50_08345 [Candidatus Eremiobacteraeota bacterium]|nr:hypothetical protein [Candidatus Eremiobacteraeota bacterium]